MKQKPQIPEAYTKIPTVPSQVSSVGFTNLKKWNSNATHGSDISTSTIKTNPLTRLFTKNKSQTYVGVPDADSGLDVINNSDDDTIATVDSRRSNRFRFGKLKQKKSKPDLTIQTGGHHGLKVSKKILSSSSLDEQNKLPRQNSVSSPASTFHSFFHRSHSNSQPNADASPSSKDDANQKRTTVSLSSSNSNSMVTDINFAMLYNFTNPDYIIDEIDGPGEHSSFLDIHKKLLVPTDQYLQNKMSHRHLTPPQEIGLGITNNPEEFEPSKFNDFTKQNSKFFNNLLSITKPIFLKSQQRRLQNGFAQPYIGYTIEDIANYVKDNYVTTLKSSPDTGLTLPSKRFKVKSKISVRNVSTNSAESYDTESFGIENLDDFRVLEISQDMSTYFMKGFSILRNDFHHIPNKDNFSPPSLHNPSEYATTIISDWIKITKIWDYFNRKVRFFLLAVFHPLQNHLHQTITENSHSLEIESLLLVSFRDSIITPSLIRRLNIYNEVSAGTLLQHEEQRLKENPELLDKVINCLGVTSSCVYSEEYTNDDSTAGLLRKTLVWLTQVRG